MDIRTLHHVSLPVTDLERSRRFYREILGLVEIERPPFPFPGAWFQLGDRQLHLIVAEDPTLRGTKGLEPRDIHLAVRVRSYGDALASLRGKGYHEDADEDDPLRILVLPRSVAGFPQLYLLDPDRHLIEINADSLDA